MKVSELAKRVGIAPSAVRFYEAEGVLPTPARGGNGYRDYTDDDLCRLRLVVSLRALGLDLHECGRLAELCSSGKCDVMERQLLDRVCERRRQVARARAELDHLDRELANVERSLGGTSALPIVYPERSTAHAT